MSAFCFSFYSISTVYSRISRFQNLEERPEQKRMEYQMFTNRVKSTVSWCIQGSGTQTPPFRFFSGSRFTVSNDGRTSHLCRRNPARIPAVSADCPRCSPPVQRAGFVFYASWANSSWASSTRSRLSISSSTSFRLKPCRRQYARILMRRWSGDLEAYSRLAFSKALSRASLS